MSPLQAVSAAAEPVSYNDSRVTHGASPTVPPQRRRRLRLPNLSFPPPHRRLFPPPETRHALEPNRALAGVLEHGAARGGGGVREGEGEGVCADLCVSIGEFGATRQGAEGAPAGCRAGQTETAAGQRPSQRRAPGIRPKGGAAVSGQRLAVGGRPRAVQQCRGGAAVECVSRTGPGRLRGSGPAGARSPRSAGRTSPGGGKQRQSRSTLWAGTAG